MGCLVLHLHPCKARAPRQEATAVITTSQTLFHCKTLIQNAFTELHTTIIKFPKKKNEMLVNAV